MARGIVVGAAALVLGGLAGCGSGAPELAPVQGKVYFHGAPLTGGTIVFAPDSDRGGAGPLAHAVIQSDGSYNLQTGGKPGAVAGWHRVSVAPRLVNGVPAQALPARYTDADLSGQHQEVKANHPNTIDLYLE